MQEIIDVINQIGFPIAVSVYLLVVNQSNMAELKKLTESLKVSIEKNNDLLNLILKEDEDK